MTRIARNITRKPISPTTPPEDSISNSAFGGWNFSSNRSVYHQRRPAPNHGYSCQMSSDCRNQTSRWYAELYWSPDSSWSWTREPTTTAPPTIATSTTLERCRCGSGRRATTAIATASPISACRDWATRMPARNSENRARQMRSFHRSQRGRA
nr:hypothetical protein [Cellulomonas hominis]